MSNSLPFQQRTPFTMGKPLAVAVLCSAALACTFVRAQTAPVFSDVTQACTGVVDTLAHELAPAVRMFGRAGKAHVVLHWRDDGPVDIVITGGPHEYRLALRRAVREFRCPFASPGDRFRLYIRFEPEADPHAGAPVAYVEPNATLPTVAQRPDHQRTGK